MHASYGCSVEKRERGGWGAPVAEIERVAHAVAVIP